MKRLLFFIILINVLVTCLANNLDSLIRFKGIILDSDSIPVENAYLINYRTLKAHATNSKGEFNIQIHRGDSLKIHHVAYEAIIVKPNAANTSQTFKLNFEENIIEFVDVKYRDLEMEYFQKNMDLIRQQLAKEFNCNYQTGYVSNPYNPTRSNTGMAGINLFDIINLIKRKL